MIRILVIIMGWLTTVNPVIAVLFGVLLFAAFFVLVTRELYLTIIDKIDALIIPEMPSSIDFAPLELMNYIFPVLEALQVLTLMMGIAVATASIRLVKSFVPTVS